MLLILNQDRLNGNIFRKIEKGYCKGKIEVIES